jgi:hypothetical protein
LRPLHRRSSAGCPQIALCAQPSSAWSYPDGECAPGSGGSSPHGQGLKTTLAQLIADETGIAPDKIRVVAGDTDRSPYSWGTFASRSLVIAGGACKLAAATLRERLQAVAGFGDHGKAVALVIGGPCQLLYLDAEIGAAQKARPAKSSM